MSAEIEKIYNQAQELLLEGDITKARKIGKDLVKKGYSGGFEILALCFLDEEKPNDAIKTLIEGTTKIPQSWLLWRQLGNLYSDQKEFEKARECYAKTHTCPGVDLSLIDFDLALTFFREENYFKSLEILDALPDEWQAQSAALKASNLNALEQYDDAIKHCRKFIAIVEQRSMDSDHSQDLPEITDFYSELASALWAKEKSTEALILLIKAIRINPIHFALAKLREIQNLESHQSNYFYLLVQGKWNEPLNEGESIPDFYRRYQIVADSLDEALEFAKILEPDEVAKTLTINESKVEEPDSGMLKGVYEASGHIFYVE